MKKVLIAVLDWGLGHATRSIPVIRAFERQGCDVLLAGSGESLVLLRGEFPSLRVLTLPAYSPRYPRKGTLMALSMARQLPRFLRVIITEHRALDKIVEQEQIDLVVSDNRYGCWSGRVRSVFITHQSNILMPRRFGFAAGWVRKLNERFMNRFDECWIPDFPPEGSLAGDLATFGKAKLKASVRYVGLLSRFESRQEKPVTTIDVLVILSGPEPQRTILEKILLPQLKASTLTFKVVRGLPSARADTGDERLINFMNASDLQLAIESAEIIIARSGYSTVMDMKVLGKKVIFIPTPGQTEQEYVARRLEQTGVAYCSPQSEFDLMAAIARSKSFSGFDSGGGNDLLVRVVEDCLSHHDHGQSKKSRA